jgi:rare lipoprotein A
VEVETIIPDAGTPAAPTVAALPASPAAAPVSVTTPLAAVPAPAATPLPAEPSAAPRPESVMTATDSPAITPVVAVTSEQKRLFLQLGAFGSQDNAENYLMRLRTQIDWLAPALHVYAKDGLFRVHAGPYSNQAEARTAADRISLALGIKAMVLLR